MATANGRPAGQSAPQRPVLETDPLGAVGPQSVGSVHQAPIGQTNERSPTRLDWKSQAGLGRIRADQPAGRRRSGVGVGWQVTSHWDALVQWRLAEHPGRKNLIEISRLSPRVEANLISVLAKFILSHLIAASH